MWEGGIRVSLIVSWPSKIEAGVTETNYVSATDIMPTLLNFANVELSDVNVDGANLF